MSLRVNKLQEFIKTEVGKAILKEIEFPQNILATVTRVEVFKDLSEAKVYFSFLPDNRAGQALELLKKKIGLIQRAVNSQLSIRRHPRLSFYLDMVERKAQHIEAMLDTIKEK